MSSLDPLAVVCDAPGKIAVRPVALPVLGPRDVLVHTLMSGVSTGTDKWVMTGRFQWDDLPFPLVPGYQLCGIVAEVGDQVRSVGRGQFVAATRAVGFSGATPAWGGHTSMAVASDDEVYDASGVAPLAASLVVSAQVGYNAASRLRAPTGSRVAVIGDGIIGASGALAAWPVRTVDNS